MYRTTITNSIMITFGKITIMSDYFAGQSTARGKPNMPTTIKKILAIILSACMVAHASTSKVLENEKIDKGK